MTQTELRKELGRVEQILRAESKQYQQKATGQEAKGEKLNCHVSRSLAAGYRGYQAASLEAARKIKKALTKPDLTKAVITLKNILEKARRVEQRISLKPEYLHAFKGTRHSGRMHTFLHAVSMIKAVEKGTLACH